MAPTGVPAKRILPQKESTLFRTILQQYETKQHKKALKSCDQILKKFPEHGETTSMKGLILTNLQKKEEGLELVKKGVRLDLTSHICWHVFGLVHKTDRNYEEALKCYAQALRFDKDNINILRDASNLFMQVRNYEGAQDARFTLLKLRPTLRQGWLALAVAYHLNDRLEDAQSLLMHYLRIVKNVPDHDVEHSEVMLYYLRVLYDLKRWNDALEFIDLNVQYNSIIDRVALLEYRARVLSALGRKDEAEEEWRRLIKQNPDCYEYYRGFLSNRGIDLDKLTDEIRAETLGLFKGFCDEYPKSTTPWRIPLDITSGDEFKELVKPYLQKGLTRGIPSLFADLKSLYVNSEKKAIIQEVMEGFKDEYRDQSNPSKVADDASPAEYLWTLYFLAQHYATDPSTISTSLSLLDTALEHTPTLPELHMIKARALKRAGDYVRASVNMENARKLDLQDRALNSKSAKYMFRVGMIEEANTLLGMFTRKDTRPASDLEDMQCFPFLIQEGDAWTRAGRLNLALKRYRAVDKTYDDIEDDQLDFHAYCVRKYTLNAYVDMTFYMDSLRASPPYERGAISAARIYVRLHDDSSLVASSIPQQSVSEKKAKKKAKRAELKVQEDAKKGTGASDDKAEAPAEKKDEDPDGMKLLTAPDPLEQAAKVLRPMEHLTVTSIGFWIVSFDVAIRRKKYLQALKALRHAKAIAFDDAQLHTRILEFKKTISSLENLPSPMSTVIAEALPELFPAESSLEGYNSDYMQKHPGSPGAILGGARGLVVIRGAAGAQEDATELVFQLLRDETRLDIQTALDALQFLEQELKSPRTEEFRSACSRRFPLSTTFLSAEEQAAVRTEMEKSAAPEESKPELDSL